jgi:hypothetical protein
LDDLIHLLVRSGAYPAGKGQGCANLLGAGPAPLRKVDAIFELGGAANREGRSAGHDLNQSSPLRPECFVEHGRAGLERGGEFGHCTGCARADGEAGFDGQPNAAFAGALGSGLVEPVAGARPATGGDRCGQGGEGFLLG